MTDKIRQAAVDCAKGWEGRNSDGFEPLAGHIERAMRKLVAAQPAEYGRSRSMDKRLTAQGKSQPAPSESPAASRHVPTLTFGAGEFSCAVCGLGMEKPCEHWKQMELVKALKGFTTDDGTWMQGATSEILFAIRAHVAERVKEAERQARLDEAKWWEHLVGAVDPNHPEGKSETCMYCQRIAELEAKR